MRFRQVALLALTLVAPLAVGCSADGANDEAESADHEIVSGGLGDVAAVKIGSIRSEGVTVAAPAKIARILENLGLEENAKTSRTEIETAGVPQVVLTLLGPHGESVASAFFIHIDGTLGSRDRQNAKGALLLRGKTYSITAKDLDAIDAIAKEPRAFADIVYGADRVVFMRPMEPWMNVDSQDRALIDKVLGAFTADDVADPNASFMRCPPATGLTFIKGTKELASVGLSCDETAAGVIQASLTTPGGSATDGALQVDATIIAEARSSLPAGTDEELPSP